MIIDNKDIKQDIKILSAVSGLSMAEIARAAGDTPQGLNQRLNKGRLQSVLNYLSDLANGCGYEFDYRFKPKE